MAIGRIESKVVDALAGINKKNKEQVDNIADDEYTSSAMTKRLLEERADLNQTARLSAELAFNQKLYDTALRNLLKINEEAA